MIKLRYDGKWTDLPGQPRQWTITSDFIDSSGANRAHGSFGLEGLQQLGIVKQEAA